MKERIPSLENEKEEDILKKQRGDDNQIIRSLNKKEQRGFTADKAGGLNTEDTKTYLSQCMERHAMDSKYHEPVNKKVDRPISTQLMGIYSNGENMNRIQASLAAGKATGLDKIPANLLKHRNVTVGSYGTILEMINGNYEPFKNKNCRESRATTLSKTKSNKIGFFGQMRCIQVLSCYRKTLEKAINNLM